MAEDKKFTEWHGVPRDKIKWNPKVDEKKCVGCGMCATGCGRNVYGWDFEKKKPVVARPNNCLVGCVTCSNTCLFGAIAFPDKERLRKIIVENGVLDRAKDELKAKFPKEKLLQLLSRPIHMSAKSADTASFRRRWNQALNYARNAAARIGCGRSRPSGRGLL